MTSLERVLLFVHVTAVVIWIGGGHLAQLLAVRAIRSGDATRMAGVALDIEWVGKRVLVPTAALTLLSGAWLVSSVGYDWGSSWVSVGLGVWLLSFLAGAFFLGPESGRIGKAIEAQGPESPEVGQRIRRILMVARVELVLLLFAVFAMTTKLWA